MNIGKGLTVLVLLSALLAVPLTGRAAETPGGQLPSEARVAFDEGMAAVGQQQWTVAIRNFLKAQKIAPEAPEVLFNLGLAESKVPGRELRAIAWFQAYLFAVPAATNAGAVRKEMVNLKVRVEGTLETLVSQAKKMAAQFPAKYDRDDPVPGPGEPVGQISRDHAFAGIAEAQAHAGDIVGCQVTCEFVRSDVWKSSCLADLASAQLEAGDKQSARSAIAKALRYATSDEALRSEWDNFIIWKIVKVQVELGDIKDAEKTAGYLDKAAYTRGKAILRSDLDLAIREASEQKAETANAGSQAKPLGTEARMTKIVVRTKFAQENLTKPVFTNLQGTLQAIAAKEKSTEMFPELVRAISDITNALKKIRDLSR